MSLISCGYDRGMTSTAKTQCHQNYMNPFATSMTLKEVPHKRIYPSAVKVGDTIAVFTKVSSLSGDGYYTWKTVGAVAHNNINYRWIFTDGTALGQGKKSPAKLEKLI